VVVALKVGNASYASSVLVTLSEPCSLLVSREGVKFEGYEGCIVRAGQRLVSASARLSICRRSGDVNSASVLVVAQLDVLTCSVLSVAEVYSARVVIVTVAIGLASRLALADVVSCRLRNAVAYSVWIRVWTVNRELTLICNTISRLANCSKSSLWAIRIGAALASSTVAENNLACSVIEVTNCLVADVEVLCERASI